MIRFGSRTVVLVPAGSAEPLVTPGARVYAGVTPIARYR
jgi:phosphatidylserine decarboxylase